jgi:hypothetical protein
MTCQLSMARDWQWLVGIRCMMACIICIRYKVEHALWLSSICAAGCLHKHSAKTCSPSFRHIARVQEVAQSPVWALGRDAHGHQPWIKMGSGKCYTHPAPSIATTPGMGTVGMCAHMVSTTHTLLLVSQPLQA